MPHPTRPDWDHFYRGRWWQVKSYLTLRVAEGNLGRLKELEPGEGPPDKIEADRKAGTIPAATLELMRRG